MQMHINVTCFYGRQPITFALLSKNTCPSYSVCLSPSRRRSTLAIALPTIKAEASAPGQKASVQLLRTPRESRSYRNLGTHAAATGPCDTLRSADERCLLGS